MLDGPDIESPLWRRFCAPVQIDPAGPEILLYNVYRFSSPEVKRRTRDVDHSPPSSAEVKERVELYVFSPYGSSWFVLVILIFCEL